MDGCGLCTDPRNRTDSRGEEDPHRHPRRGRVATSGLFNPTEDNASTRGPRAEDARPPEGDEPSLEFTAAALAPSWFETAFDTTATDESVYRKHIVRWRISMKVDEELSGRRGEGDLGC